MKILVATTNKGKFEEIRRILDPFGYEVLLPPEALEVEETGKSFLENAFIKAKVYYERFKLPTLADDSGLVVEALGGMPGIYSSRFYSIDFGGREEVRNSADEANIRKLLRLLEGKRNRKASFVAYMVMVAGKGGLFSWGECKGRIGHTPLGRGGFGYDPIFIPEGYDRTMAQLTPEEKDNISHRGKALMNLLPFLKGLEGGRFG